MIKVLIIIVVVLVAFLSPLSAWAIANPDAITINEVTVWRSLWEAGDMLFYCRYDLAYASEPSEPASTSFYFIVYDTTGTVVKKQVHLNYYQHNIISIHFSASEAAALLWGSTYIVRIVGNPALFPLLVEGTNMKSWTLDAGDWKLGSASSYFVDQALALQTDSGVTLLNSQNLLNTTGALYFNTAIPNLASVYPEIYSVASSSPTVTRGNYSRAYAASLSAHAGTTLNNGLKALGIYFGISQADPSQAGNWMAFWILLLGFGIVAGLVFAATKRPEMGAILGFSVFIIGGWMFGGEILTFVIILTFIMALIFGIMFLLARLA